MKSVLKNIVASVALVLFVYCSLNFSFKKNENRVIGMQKDTSIVDIPKNSRDNYRWIYRACKRDEKLLGLDSLQIGFDSLQIRIWFESGLYYKKQVIILKNSNSIWEGQLLSWALDYGDEQSPKYTIINKKAENISPKSGWDRYITKLVSLNILTLPDDSNIKGIESGGGDLRMTSVEIATKNMYRFYNYTEPDGYDKMFKELKDMENIIKRTIEEFPALSQQVQ